MSTLQAVVAIVVALLAGGGIAGFLTSKANAQRVEILTTDARYGTLLDRVQKQLDLCLARESVSEAQLAAMTKTIGENTVAIATARADAAETAVAARVARAEVVRLEDRLSRLEVKYEILSEQTNGGSAEAVKAAEDLGKQFGAR